MLSKISNKIKVSYIPNKGYGIIAVKDIKPNEVLIIDDIVTIDIKKPEQIYSDIFQLLYKVLNDSILTKKFMMLYPKNTSNCNIKLDIHTIMIELNKVKLYNKLMYEYFTTNFTQNELLLYTMKYTCNAFQYKDGLPSFLFTGRLLNHSCLPNVIFNCMEDTNKMVFVSIKHIKKGEEVCDNYVNILDSVEQRKKRLLEQYGFECNCERCIIEQYKKHDEYKYIANEIVNKKHNWLLQIY